MKSRAGYVLAAVCLLTGVGVAGWLAWSGYAQLRDALVRFVVPGSVELTLDRPGSYTIFHETESVVDGKLYTAPTIGGLRVTVTGDNGEAINVVTPGFNASYAIGGHSGKSVLAFEVAKPGPYRLVAVYPEGRAEPRTVLAVDRGFVGPLLRTIFGAVGSTFVGFIAALALALTTYFRRRRLVRTA